MSRAPLRSAVCLAAASCFYLQEDDDSNHARALIVRSPCIFNPPSCISLSRHPLQAMLRKPE